ncbi:MAG: cation transporter, partial [Elusimicrobia bacterium]|nr:cation transporter [Elusimicrobiota bacterium]
MLTFRIGGMDCAEEVAVLKRELGPLVGGEERLTFDLMNGTMTVLAPVDPEKIIARVAKMGMSAALAGGEPADEHGGGSWRG